MKVQCDQLGFVLIFQSLEDLESHVANLNGMIEWVKKEEVAHPYVYSVSDERTPPPEIQQRNILVKISHQAAEQFLAQAEEQQGGPVDAGKEKTLETPTP